MKYIFAGSVTYYFLLIRWMNGQHLRSLPLGELIKIFGDQWKRTGILLEAEGSFVKVFHIYIAGLEFFLFVLTLHSASIV